jgi:hypothetical protein
MLANVSGNAKQIAKAYFSWAKPSSHKGACFNASSPLNINQMIKKLSSDLAARCLKLSDDGQGLTGTFDQAIFHTIVLTHF